MTFQKMMSWRRCASLVRGPIY